MPPPQGATVPDGSGAELRSVGISAANITVLTLIVTIANGCSPC